MSKAKTRIGLSVVLLFGLSAVSVSCKNDAQRPAAALTEDHEEEYPTETAADEERRYFGGTTSKVLPILPVGQISKSQAEAFAGQGYAYYEAEYGSAGELVTLTKWYRGDRLSICQYRYHPNGALATQILQSPSDEDVADTIHYFDDEGQFVRTEQVPPQEGGSDSESIEE